MGDPVSGKIYTFTNVESNLAMDCFAADNNIIIGYQKHGGSNQQWKLTYGANNAWKIQSMGNNQYLGIEHGGAQEGGNIFTTPNSDYQWLIDDAGQGAYTFTPEFSAVKIFHATFNPNVTTPAPQRFPCITFQNPNQDPEGRKFQAWIMDPVN